MRLEEIIFSHISSNGAAACYWWQGQWYDRKHFGAMVDSCTRVLEESGFGSGHRFGALLPNSPLLNALSVACWRLGGALAPINAKAGAEAIIRTLNMLDVHGVVVPAGAEVADKISAMGIPAVYGDQDGCLQPFLGVGGTPDSTDTAVIFSTSGTTGLPKAVTITHGNLKDNADRLVEQVTLLGPQSILLNALPNFHTLGYSIGGMLSLIHGMRQTIVPSFVPADAALSAIIDSGVDIVVAVPAMVSLLLGAASRGGVKPTSISAVICGGDRLNIVMDNRCREILGAALLEGYGLTECSPVVAVNPNYEGRRLGTVGPYLKSYEIKLCDLDGNVLPEGNEGVLWVRGPSVTPGYFRDPENTAARFKDGWFNTGDVVRIDDDNYVTVLDRATDIIIVGGFNVYPQEVERTLSEYPGVQMCAASGEPNSMTGEIVKVFIVPKPGEKLNSRDIIAFCKEKLAHFKVPRKVVFVDELPISPTGKVLRRELRNMKD